MKTVITFAIAIFCTVSTLAAPANLFSAIPATTKSETKPVKPNFLNSSDEQSSYFPDYKILQRGMKRLEYQYHLFA